MKNLITRIKNRIICPHLKTNLMRAEARGKWNNFFFIYSECQRCGKQTDLTSVYYTGMTISQGKPIDQITWGRLLTDSDRKEIKDILDHPDPNRKNPTRMFMEAYDESHQKRVV